MPELLEQMYCSQQIVIPPKYPYILKRFCKAAIKTQPYDLLRWAFEYFRALAEHRPPPVKLRLEYPIYSTEGGLTRGCLKVLAQQLHGMKEIPVAVLRQAWQGFCLDPNELKRILCLCEVYLRNDFVPFLHFLGVAGGMLTKCLTHTMILLCESLTKEPDGGSAAIPVDEFITMYIYLARMDASKDVKYHDGFREGHIPVPEEICEEEQTEVASEHEHAKLIDLESDDDDYWGDNNLQKLTIIDDNVARTARLSVRLTLPPIGNIERSPSIERIREIERDNYMRERKGRAAPSEDVDKKLKQLGASRSGLMDTVSKPGEPKKEEETVETEPTATDEEGAVVLSEKEKLTLFLTKVLEEREERLNDLENAFNEIAVLVDRYRTANYDLGMVAGRQMSTTSGEFIVQHIEKEILAYIDEQIAILPDPDLKKKKAKPEEVAMVRDILEQFLEDNMDIIVPEVEEVEEEEAPIPEITMVYAVPGIGGPVSPDIISDFVDYAKEVSKVQADMMMPRNIRHFLCPPLEKYIEHNYVEFETQPKKEEVATGGAITD